jgi:glycosyltransferase involved in cell wall biosynthesis
MANVDVVGDEITGRVARTRDIADSRDLVYLACPWGPFGGGMYKVADYLRQAEAIVPGGPRFRIIDSRGPRLAAFPFVLMLAAVRIIYGRLSGRMRLLHLNLAHGMSTLRKVFLIYCARLVRAPVVVHVHAARLPQSYKAFPGFVQWIVKDAFNRANCVIALGESIQNFLIHDLNVAAARVVQLTNGVPCPPYRHQSLAGVSEFRLLFLGSQFERKGLADLMTALSLPAVASLPWRLIVAGGDDPDSYKTRALELGIASRVEFTGWVSQEGAAALLASSHALILPSYDEGLPLVILEALGHGLPVVCTPVGEIPQFLTDGENALFVTPGDAPAIGKALVDLMTLPDLSSTLSRAGRELFERRFSLQAFIAGLAEIYDKYCGPARGGAVRS